jgi:Zn-finger nucleic acid-binding protein
MSVTPSSMNCPVCPDQLMSAVAAAIGEFAQCPACSGIFIRQELIAAASADRGKCLEALDETKSLLLPIDRRCPKCLQMLQEGRVRSRGVILTLCPSCETLWTTLPVVHQFDPVIARTLRLQMDLAMNPDPSSTPAKASPAMLTPRHIYLEHKESTGVGKFIRSIARFFDRWADRWSESSSTRTSRAPSPSKPPKPAEPAKPRQKPPSTGAEQGATPPVAAPSTLPAPTPAPSELKPTHELDIPEFVFPAGTFETEPSPTPPVEPTPAPQPMQVPEPTPLPEPAPTPEPVPAPVAAAAVRAEPAPTPKPKPKRPGLFERLKSAWSPTPSKTPKPIAAKPVAAKPDVPKPIAPKPVEVKPPRVSLLKKLSDFFAPKPRAKPAPKPSPKPSPEPAPKPISAEPAIPKPASAPAKQAPKIKPKREKGPKPPVDRIAVWSPWALAAMAVGASTFRDFGFEAGPAVLWGLAGWATGLMIRFSRVYPFHAFKESTLQALADQWGSQGNRPVPVILQGQIVPAKEEEPKGKVIFKQLERIALLNPVGLWDVIPRLFGLANPRQILKGEVIVKGWYRGGPAPAIEIHEIRADKVRRASMVKMLRWGTAAALWVLAIIIYFSLE